MTLSLSFGLMSFTLMLMISLMDFSLRLYIEINQYLDSGSYRCCCCCYVASFQRNFLTSLCQKKRTKFYTNTNLCSTTSKNKSCTPPHPNSEIKCQNMGPDYLIGIGYVRFLDAVSLRCVRIEIVYKVFGWNITNGWCDGWMKKVRLLVRKLTSGYTT